MATARMPTASGWVGSGSFVTLVRTGFTAYLLFIVLGLAYCITIGATQR